MAHPSDTPPTDAPPSAQEGPGKRKRLTTRKFRWNVRFIIGVPVLLALVVLLLMRSPLVGSVVASSLKSQTGCTIEGLGATGAYIDLDGRLVMRHFLVRLPGVPGDAGILMSAEQATIDLDWSGILTGDVTPTAIRLHQPIFRVSQGIEDGELNIGALASRAVPRGAGPKSMPRIDAIDGTIIIAEHPTATGAVNVLREMHVSGSFTPIDPTRPLYTLRFSETGVPREQALLLDGRVNIDTGAVQLKLYNVALNIWRPESIPTAYRDLWRRMNVQGRISSASMNYDKAEGARVEINLDGVSMNALIPAEGSTPDAMQDLGLRDVSGVVRFSPAGMRAGLTGKLEGQSGESTVTLITQGLDLNSALSCEIVATRLGLTKETELLPYMPERVKQYFRLFSGPTGEVDARVLISRGAPVNGVAAEIGVSGGRVNLKHGSAAFTRFPYPFEEMTGTFEFDDHALHIVELQGRGPTGATLKGTGIISPLTDEAMVDVNVHAEHVLVDQYLLDAMPGDRRRVLENVFSQPEYLRLVADGLVRVPGSPVEKGAPSPPEFALAGECTIDVNVHTPEGKDAPWYTTIDVGFATAGMLVDPFPLPVLARNVKLHITDDDAKLLAGEFAPLSGGTMQLSAAVTFFNQGKRETRPDVRISAQDVPVDRLLLHALPQDEETRGVDPATAPAKDLSLGELMRRLNASGTAACEALITADPAQPGHEAEAPKIAYDVHVDLANVRAAPILAGEEPSFSVEDFRGTLHVTRTRLELPELHADLFRMAPKDGSEPFIGPIQCAGLSLTLNKNLGGDESLDRGRMEATLAVSGANLSEPLERFVGVFSPETGKRLADLRTERQPVGRVHTTVHMLRPPGENVATGIGVTLDNASNIEFTALGGRVGVDWPEGVIEIVVPTEGPEQLHFDKVRARLSLDGASCGEARVDGTVTIDAATGGVAPPADLSADFADWRFESPLILPLLERLTSASTADAYRALKAVGPFDAILRVQTDGDPKQPSPAASVKADLSPKAMAFDWEGQRVTCDGVSGKVTLRTLAGAGAHPVSGQFDHLDVKTAGWDATVDGAWYAPAYAATPGGNRPVQLAVTFGITGRTLDPALKALMPASAVEALGALDAQFHGPFTLRDGAVRTTLGDAPSRTTFTGDLEFSDLAFSVGVPVEHCTGRVAMNVQTGGGAPGPDKTIFQIKAHADTLRVAGVAASSAETTVVTGEAPGEILLPEITALCYAGRLTGHAKITLPESSLPGAAVARARYEAEVVLSGVHLAPVLADAAAAGATDPGPVGPPNPFTDPDPSRGELDARVNVAGIAGDLSSRTGGGAIRISNGDIIRLPMMLPLIQVSNLQIPSKDRLGYMQSDFMIAGDTAVFDHVSLLSKSVAIVGAGTLKWPDFTLDMKFNSRSLSRVPILSDLFEALRNEIVSTTVKGKLSDPIVREEPFTFTRRLLDRLLHPSAYADLPGPIPPSGPGSGAQAERRRIQGASEATAVPNQP